MNKTGFVSSNRITSLVSAPIRFHYTHSAMMFRSCLAVIWFRELPLMIFFSFLFSGIEYLCENNLLQMDAQDVAHFLYKGEGLNKTAIGKLYQYSHILFNECDINLNWLQVIIWAKRMISMNKFWKRLLNSMILPIWYLCKHYGKFL